MKSEPIVGVRLHVITYLNIQRPTCDKLEILMFPEVTLLCQCSNILYMVFIF